MKILTNNQYKQIQEELSVKSKLVTALEIELRESRNLKEILESLSNKTLANGVTLSSVAYVNTATGISQLNIPDNVLVYVDDILGGKVIKQEGVRCLVLNKDGDVKTGLTKQPADKGYSYKLVRACA